jgi:hypothetical protein
MNLLARTSFEMNPLKSTKSYERRSLERRELEIDLHNLISRDFACVRHCHVGTYWLIGCLCWSGTLRSLYLKVV